MKNLIIFTTKYGSVALCANLLAEKLAGETVIINLKTDKIPDLSTFDKIIMAGSIYIGKTQPEITEFATKNSAILLEKVIGIYVNSGEKTEKKYEQIKRSFPKELYNKAVAVGLFGDAISIEKCSFIDKLALRLMKSVKKSYSNIDENEIEKFANKMNAS